MTLLSGVIDIAAGQRRRSVVRVGEVPGIERGKQYVITVRVRVNKLGETDDGDVGGVSWERHDMDVNDSQDGGRLDSARQGLTLVHFHGQPEPILRHRSEPYFCHTTT